MAPAVNLTETFLRCRNVVSMRTRICCDGFAMVEYNRFVSSSARRGDRWRDGLLQGDRIMEVWVAKLAAEVDPPQSSSN
jgi:hypothetical protein